MSPEQCKMARAGLGLGVRDLAALADVSTNTITRLERGEELKEGTLVAIQKALEDTGVDFMEKADGSIGVMLKPSKK